MTKSTETKNMAGEQIPNEKLAEVSGGEARRYECKGRLVSCQNCWYPIPVNDFPVSDDGIPLDQEITCPVCHFTFTIN